MSDLLFDKIDWKNEGKLYWNDITEYIMDEASNTYDLKYLFGFHRLKPATIIKPHGNAGVKQILFSNSLEQYITLGKDDSVNVFIKLI